MHRHCSITTSRLALVASLFGLVSALFGGVLAAQEATLYDAIRFSRLSVVEDFLSRGGDPNHMAADVNGDRWPLLAIALYDREEDIALALLSAGADFGASDIRLDQVAREGMDRALRFLLQQDPTRLSEANAEERSLLIRVSAGRGYYQVLDVLLEESRRFDIGWAANELSDALDAAISRRQFDLARELLDSGAPLSRYTIHIAARNGSPGIVRELLERGADAGMQLLEDDADPLSGATTPLESAWYRYNRARGADSEIARLILFEVLRAGAGVSKVAMPADVPRDGIRELNAIENGSERIIEAARLGFYDVVAAMLRGTIEESALTRATSAALESRNNDIAFLLIDHGARLDEHVLHAAARGNSPGIVRYLLERGLDPNLRLEGRTALEAWWERSRREDLGVGGDYVLHELLDAGAEGCWLMDYADQLNSFESIFLRNTAPECW